MRLSSEKIRAVVCSLFAFTFLGICSVVTAQVPTQAPKLPPIDNRIPVPPDTFSKAENGEMLSAVNKTPFEFDELIYSWKAQLPEGEGFRVYLQFAFADGDKTNWEYAGFWGKVKPFQGVREIPKFAQGKIEMDQVLLNKKADSFQVKVVSEGDKPLSAAPMFQVIVTDNSPTQELSTKFTPVYNRTFTPKILDLPLRRQQTSKGIDTADRCQSAAVSTAMQFFGKALPLEDVIAFTNDPEYDYPGIWPRTVGAAAQNGFEAYIDRFRTWDDVKATIDKDRVILASITMPRKPKGFYEDPPYSHIGGHIVAISGWTEDGRVIVTDSYLPRNDEGYKVQWLQKDFEKIWMDTKGGVGMVICPPKDAKIKYVTGPVPEFPKNRTKRRDIEEMGRNPAVEGLRVLTNGKSPEETQAIKNAFWKAWYEEFDKKYQEALERGE